MPANLRGALPFQPLAALLRPTRKFSRAPVHRICAEMSEFSPSVQPPYAPAVQRLLDGHAHLLYLIPHPRDPLAAHDPLAPTVREDEAPPNLVLLPGSFNPLHPGHLGLLRAATQHTGRSAGVLELSILNADKGFLSLSSILPRVDAALRAGVPICLTAAPLFSDKARLFEGATFVVGHDTAHRIVQAR